MLTRSSPRRSGLPPGSSGPKSLSEGTRAELQGTGLSLCRRPPTQSPMHSGSGQGPVWPVGAPAFMAQPHPRGSLPTLSVPFPLYPLRWGLTQPRFHGGSASLPSSTEGSDVCRAGTFPGSIPSQIHGALGCLGIPERLTWGDGPCQPPNRNEFSKEAAALSVYLQIADKLTFADHLLCIQPRYPLAAYRTEAPGSSSEPPGLLCIVTCALPHSGPWPPARNTILLHQNHPELVY